MRATCLLLFVAMFLGTRASAQVAHPAGTSAELEISARIRARLDAVARGNASEWAALVADDCICGLETKAGIQRAIATRLPTVKNWYGEILDLRIRLLGEAAAVARYRVTEYTEVDGKLSSLQAWRTETLTRQANGWMLVAGAETVIPPDPVPVKVPSRLLDDYVGRYEYTPGSVDTVTREGDRLFVQPSGEPRVELLPESESTYFAKGEPWRIIFVRATGGAVTGLIFRQQGQEWAAKRLGVKD